LSVSLTKKRGIPSSKEPRKKEEGPSTLKGKYSDCGKRIILDVKKKGFLGSLGR